MHRHKFLTFMFNTQVILREKQFLPKIVFFYKTFLFLKKAYNVECGIKIDVKMIAFKNKRAQRALGRSPEEKVKGHSGANNREPQGHSLNNFGRGPIDDVIYEI